MHRWRLITHTSPFKTFTSLKLGSKCIIHKYICLESQFTKLAKCLVLDHGRRCLETFALQQHWWTCQNHKFQNSKISSKIIPVFIFWDKSKLDLLNWQLVGRSVGRVVGWLKFLEFPLMWMLCATNRTSLWMEKVGHWCSTLLFWCVDAKVLDSKLLQLI